MTAQITQTDFWNLNIVKQMQGIQKRNPHGSTAHREAHIHILTQAKVYGVEEHLESIEDYDKSIVKKKFYGHLPHDFPYDTLDEAIKDLDDYETLTEGDRTFIYEGDTENYEELEIVFALDGTYTIDKLESDHDHN